MCNDGFAKANPQFARASVMVISKDRSASVSMPFLALYHSQSNRYLSFGDHNAGGGVLTISTRVKRIRAAVTATATRWLDPSPRFAS